MNRQGRQKFDLQSRLIDFTALIIDIVEALPDTRVGNHIGGQLLRSGTAPAPNYGEAQAAESRRDFVHKLKLGLKELRETHVWLSVMRRKGLSNQVDGIEKALPECDQLIAIFVSSIATAQRRMGGIKPGEYQTRNKE